MSFETFSFSAEINETLKLQGFETPTPIQAQAIPEVIAGKDIMGLAQTGTGKTAAFVLPMIQRLSQTKSENIRALIVAPTRELAQQIYEVVKIFGEPVGLKSTAVYGGMSMGRQLFDIKRGVDILIACPGRLLDHMQQRTVNLSKIEMLVLDEADQMFDMGFLPSIRRIVKALPQQRQTLLFSATMPEEIRGLAEQILKNPITVKAGSIAPVASVTHALYPVERHLKGKLVLELLKHTDTDSVLIFVRTKHGAKGLAQRIKDAGFKVTSLQGNLRQNQRARAMDGFRNGSYQIMVATDIAARGLDIASISHVINYDIPDTVEAYTHRIGRTGRAAKTGDAFTLVSPDDFYMVKQIERAMKAPIERRTVEGFPYQASQKDIMKEEFSAELSGKTREPVDVIEGEDEEGQSSERRPRREGRSGGQGRGGRDGGRFSRDRRDGGRSRGGRGEGRSSEGRGGDRDFGGRGEGRGDRRGGRKFGGRDSGRSFEDRDSRRSFDREDRPQRSFDAGLESEGGFSGERSTEGSRSFGRRSSEGRGGRSFGSRGRSFGGGRSFGNSRGRSNRDSSFGDSSFEGRGERRERSSSEGSYGDRDGNSFGERKSSGRSFGGSRGGRSFGGARGGRKFGGSKSRGFAAKSGRGSFAPRRDKRGPSSDME
jgi:ATP-dependent RNA helicase RhlE